MDRNFVAHMEVTKHDECPVITRELSGFVLDVDENEEGTTYTIFVPRSEPYFATSVPMTPEEIEANNRSMFPEPKDTGKKHYQSIVSKGGGPWKLVARMEGEEPWWDERNSWEKM